MAGHVFLSHAPGDREAADGLCARLEALGVKVWMAPRDVRLGVDYSEALQAAIETSMACVVLISAHGNASPYVRAETEMAFSTGRPIFPVRFAEVEPAPGLAFFLNIRHWTEAFGPAAEANLARLGAELAGLAAAAPPPPPPPAPAAAPPPPPAAPPPARRKTPPALWIGLGVGGLLVLLVLLGSLGGQRSQGVPPNAPPAARGLADELVDFGIAPKAELETNVGSPTPFTIPAGERLTTAEVQRMTGDAPPPLLVDVLGNPHLQTLPGALYLPAGGMAGAFTDAVQSQFSQQLAAATGGDLTRPIVFFCQGASCWESYNAALRAQAAGYRRIYWYRGGLAAWSSAGLPMVPLPASGQSGSIGKP